MEKIAKKYFYMALVCVFSLCLTACSDDEEKDMTYPVISDAGIVADPIDCQQYRRGEVIPFQYVFTDDTELGNYIIEIHNNFSHHTHGTSSVECEGESHMSHEELEELEREHPEQLWTHMFAGDIPDGLRSYTARVDIPIPANIHTGDYHFVVRLTDKAGWQQLKAVAIRIIE